jgi:tRNA (adenine57-N1/adenine58-N1)-methyltransferase
VEAGTGSGALTINLAYYVQPNGHVYTYDISEKSSSQAKKNIEKVKLAEYITLKMGDVCSAIEETDVDVVMLDLATPWLAINNAWGALKGSGSICCFSPTIEQVKKNVEALKHGGFADVRTFELLCRDYQVKENATRPGTSMVGHTGFMTFGRKVEREAEVESFQEESSGKPEENLEDSASNENE